MNDSEILASELSKIPLLTGGAVGAALSAKMLPNETVEASFEISSSPTEVTKMVFEVLEKEGNIFKNEFETNVPMFSAVVGSGFMNMNPVVIHISVEPATGQKSKVIIQAISKEGLIKQHSSEKCIERLKSLIINSFTNS